MATACKRPRHNHLTPTPTRGPLHDQVLLQPRPQPDEGGAVPRGSRPALRGRSGGHAQGRAARRPSRRSTRTPRCRRSSTATPPCSTATPSCCTWPRRPASSCPPTRPRRAAQMLSWLMFVASGIGPFSRPVRALQALRARAQGLCGEPLRLRGLAPLDGILNDQLAERPYMLGDELQRGRHGGVGLGAARCPLCWATRPGTSCRT